MISGAFGVLLTPFTEQGAVDYDAYEKELDFIARSEIAGCFVCGTTGEFVSLSPEENMEMLQFTANRLGGKKRLLAGASDPNPSVTLSYLRAAESMGYEAAVICPPYYFTMGQDDIARYYEALCAHNIIDLVLYKIPMFTNTIEQSTFERLLQQPRIIAMKDSSANIKQIAHEADLVRRNRPDFSLLCGTDDSLVPSLTAGCIGSMTAFSTILPEVNSKIYDLFWQGKVLQAELLNRSYLNLLRMADSLMFPSGYKLVFERRGFSMGQCQVADREAMERLIPKMDEELKKVLGGVQ